MILVVDDDEFARKYLRVVLTRAGLDVNEAGTAAMALQLVDKDPFDLVMIDLYLPDGSGIQLGVQIRAIRPELPLFLLSGSLQDAEGVMDHCTFQAILGKPIRPRMLLDTVERFLPH